MIARFELPIVYSKEHAAWHVEEGHGGPVIQSFDSLHEAECWVVAESIQRERKAKAS